MTHEQERQIEHAEHLLGIGYKVDFLRGLGVPEAAIIEAKKRRGK